VRDARREPRDLERVGYHGPRRCPDRVVRREKRGGEYEADDEQGRRRNGHPPRPRTVRGKILRKGVLYPRCDGARDHRQVPAAGGRQSRPIVGLVISEGELSEARLYASARLAEAGVVLSDEERDSIEVADFGLSQLNQT